MRPMLVHRAMTRHRGGRDVEEGRGGVGGDRLGDQRLARAGPKSERAGGKASKRKWAAEATAKAAAAATGVSFELDP